MSLAERQALVDSPHTLFQSDSQRADFLDPDKTSTELVALVMELVGAGHNIEFTAVNSDHHDDSGLGPHCHHLGKAFDCWPLNSTKAGDYAGANSPTMIAFLRAAWKSSWLFQMGFAGSAQSINPVSSLGQTHFSERLFLDDGGDHIHLGVI